MLETIKSLIDRDRQGLRQLADDIWCHPELAWQERYACQRAADFLAERGFKVETGCYGVETAFRTEYGSGSPVFAIAAEYDALPEIGHACGHNLICAAGLAAFCAGVTYMKENNLPGKLVLLGTPAEEGAGGKVRMQEAGCLKGVDAVMMVHPSARNMVDTGSTAVVGEDVTFYGKAAHAAGMPDKGINALDAAMLLFAAVNAYRQQMPSSELIHGIVTNGGAAPNIIPDKTTVRFYIRSNTTPGVDALTKRFHDMVRGAELMTGATSEISIFHVLYNERKPNAAMNQCYIQALEKLGAEIDDIKPGRGSSDFGNFSQEIPGIHSYFNIFSGAKGAGHSIETREAAHSDYGFDSAMRAAASMANVAMTFMTNPDFREQVKKDFEK